MEAVLELSPDRATRRGIDVALCLEAQRQPRPRNDEESEEEYQAVLAAHREAIQVPCNQLLERHMLFVWSRTIAFCNMNPRYHAEELIGEATLAFFKAIHGFDVNRGTMFLTYAGPTIWQNLTAFAQQDGVVRVPPCSIAKCRDPESGTRAKAEAALRRPISLSRPLGDDWNGVDLPAPEADEGAALPSFDELEGAIGLLTDREALIVRERAKGRTLREIAPDVGVTHERVRQIEEKAFATLRGALGFDPKARSSWIRTRQRELSE